MAAVRSLRSTDKAARTAALPILRLVRDGSLRASRRSRPAQAHQPWRGAAVSVALHVALLAAFLWQTPGGEPASGTAVEVVFWAATDAQAESPSGDVRMEIEEASAPAEAEPPPDAPPVDAPTATVVDPEPPPVEMAAPAESDPPPPEPAAKVAADAPADVPPPPVEPAVIAPAEPVPPPEPVAQVAITAPSAAQPLPPPPPPRPVVRKRPIETAPRPKPDAVPASAAAAQAAPVATAAAAAAPPPASAPLPQGEIPVIHEARFRVPPAPARYPSRAVDLSQQGTVIVRALVAPDGTADDIIVWRSSGYALLDAAALRAVRKWSFEPASVGRRRITAWVEVPVRFAIR